MLKFPLIVSILLIPVLFIVKDVSSKILVLTIILPHLSWCSLIHRYMYLKDTLIIYIILGVIWTTLANSLKSFLASGSRVCYCMVLGGSTVISGDLTSFKISYFFFFFDSLTPTNPLPPYIFSLSIQIFLLCFVTHWVFPETYVWSGFETIYWSLVDAPLHNHQKEMISLCPESFIT